jgi:ribonuclease VapC
VDLEQGREARDAFSRFGEGRHAAALNFGDCFSYALATVLGEPLLFKGEHLARTDIPGQGTTVRPSVPAADFRRSS